MNDDTSMTYSGLDAWINENASELFGVDRSKPGTNSFVPYQDETIEVIMSRKEYELYQRWRANLSEEERETIAVQHPYWRSADR